MLPFVRERECELDDPRLRAGDQRDLALGVERDAVDVAVASSERFLRAREAPDRRVAMHLRSCGARRERFGDVRRRPELGVPAPQVDERRSFLGRGGGDAPEERDEVLLRQPFQAFWPPTHLGDSNEATRLRR